MYTYTEFINLGLYGIILCFRNQLVATLVTSINEVVEDAHLFS